MFVLVKYVIFSFLAVEHNLKLCRDGESRQRGHHTEEPVIGFTSVFTSTNHIYSTVNLSSKQMFMCIHSYGFPIINVSGKTLYLNLLSTCHWLSPPLQSLDMRMNRVKLAVFCA